MAIFWEHIKGKTSTSTGKVTTIVFKDGTTTTNGYPEIKVADVSLGNIVTTGGDGQTINKALTVSGLIIANGGINGTTGTFSGAVSGTTGIFSGTVSGTTGTFSGAVSGTTGTFTSSGSFKTSLKRDGKEVALQENLTSEISAREVADTKINERLDALGFNTGNIVFCGQTYSPNESQSYNNPGQYKIGKMVTIKGSVAKQGKIFNGYTAYNNYFEGTVLRWAPLERAIGSLSFIYQGDNIPALHRIIYIDTNKNISQGGFLSKSTGGNLDPNKYYTAVFEISYFIS